MCAEAMRIVLLFDQSGCGQDCCCQNQQFGDKMVLLFDQSGCGQDCCCQIQEFGHRMLLAVIMLSVFKSCHIVICCPRGHAGAQLSGNIGYAYVQSCI